VKDFKTNQTFYHGVLLDITEYRALKDSLKGLGGR
jgi:hypothetical protein